MKPLGVMTLDDLEDYHMVVTKPLLVNYRGTVKVLGLGVQTPGGPGAEPLRGSRGRASEGIQGQSL